MGLRLSPFNDPTVSISSFSPVARIHGVATRMAKDADLALVSFSPVARIHGVATYDPNQRQRYRSQVSVPLPGFMGLRRFFGAEAVDRASVSVPLPGFMGLRRRSHRQQCYPP